MRVRGLAGEPAAIDIDGGAGHIVGGGGGEEDADAFKVVWGAPAAGGNAVEDGLVALGVGADGGGVVGGDIAGGDGIDADAVFGEFVGHQHGEALDAAFGGGVTGHEDAALEAEHGGHVNDFAALPLGNHLTCGGLGEEEGRGEIDGEDVVPILGGVLGEGLSANDAGVVHEDIEPPEVCHDIGNECRGGFFCGGEVNRIGFGLAAEGFDLCDGLFG